MLSKNFFLDIKAINLAHEFTLDRVHRCAYPSGRALYGMVYAISGAATYRFSEGVSVTVGEGDVLLLSSSAAYSIVTEHAFRHYTVNFDVHAESSFGEPFAKPYCLLSGGNTEHLKRAFADLIHIRNGRKVGFEMQSVGRLYELLSIFCADYLHGRNSKSDRGLLAAREYVDQHYGQPMSLEQLSRIASMSVTNFRREWSRRYGETPMQYRDSIRLHYAREYLSSGYYTVSEVARLCGFEDVSYFVRFFRKKTGLTPGEYRHHVTDE